MRIAIWGCRDGAYLYEQLIRGTTTDYEVMCFVDSNTQYQNTRIRGIEVLNIKQLAEKYRKHEIDMVVVAVRKGYSRYSIIRQLEETGIDQVMLLKPMALICRVPIVFEKENPLYSRQWYRLGESKKPLIHHLEVHAADGCNLNCKGCLHFANLYGKDEFPDLEKLLGDIEVISRNCDIFQFRILGGEPLLNKKLPDFLRKLRILLPDTDLAVISNGILIPTADPELFSVMHDYYISFNLTLYPPTLKMKDQIYRTLQKYHVAYGSHEVKTDEFERFLMLKGKNTDTKVYQSCVSRGILVIRDGKLYKCPMETYIKRYFETWPMEIKTAQGIDFREITTDWKKIIDQLYSEKGEFCHHCAEKPEVYEWENGKPEKEDWLVRGM